MNHAEIRTYLLTAMAAVLTAVAGWLGTRLKVMAEQYIHDRTKREVVRTCVSAVEQLYRDLDGEEKLHRAEAGAREMLEEKNISITELELKMLIEAVVSGFNYGLCGKKEALFALHPAQEAEEPAQDYREEAGASR